jgi:hypothetical protein
MPGIEAAGVEINPQATKALDQEFRQLLRDEGCLYTTARGQKARPCQRVLGQLKHYQHVSQTELPWSHKDWVPLEIFSDTPALASPSSPARRSSPSPIGW